MAKSTITPVNAASTSSAKTNNPPLGYINYSVEYADGSVVRMKNGFPIWESEFEIDPKTGKMRNPELHALYSAAKAMGGKLEGLKLHATLNVVGVRDQEDTPESILAKMGLTAVEQPPLPEEPVSIN